MATFKVPDVLIDWLASHEGSRLVLHVNTHGQFAVELCARDLVGLEADEARYINHDAPCTLHQMVEMVQDMIEWEAKGWIYVDDNKLLDEIFGPLPN